MQERNRIAVLIPCYNEELTVGKVVSAFARELPEATIYVFDNASTDRTAAIAREHGAIVRSEPKKGKGFVVRTMLESVPADFYVMVDGDDTYPAERVRDLLQPVIAGQADMTVGTRLAQHTQKAFRQFHVLGNNLVRRLINLVFRGELKDIMSGYRAFNGRVVRYLPVVSGGFEIETEMTIQMLYHGLTIAEIPVTYVDRPPGSASKLSTFRDGFRVLWKIFCLFRDYKPLTFFGLVALLLFGLGGLAGILPILDYARERYVHHVPLAILATGLEIMATGVALLGLLLHILNWRLKELHSVVVRRDG